MKRLLLIVFAFAALGAAVNASAAGPDTLWDEANNAYFNSNYAEAISLYDSLEQSGLTSAKLYYNMGNAYFKAGRIGKSILYYNKAQRLAPSNDDIAHNLAIANSFTRNNIEPLPQFFLTRWLNGFASIMNGGGWAVTSIVLLAVALGGLLAYLLPLRRRLRKAGFFTALAAVVLLGFAVVFAARDHRESIHSTHAIVTSPSASVKSSPDNAGKDLFLLYEGAKVRVRDRLNGWCEITLEDGNRGWVKNTAIEMID